MLLTNRDSLRDCRLASVTPLFAVSDVVLGIGAAWLSIIFVLGFPRVLRDWRNGPQSFEPADWWPSGRRLWRMWQRSDVVSGFGVMFLLGFGWLEVVDPSSPLLDTVRNIFLGLAVATLPFLLTTSAWGWPRVLIPARLRDGIDVADGESES